MVRKIRVAIIHDTVQHYRAPVFRRLASDPVIDLEVIHGRTSVSPAKLGLSRAEIQGFNHTEVWNLYFRVGSYALLVQPSVPVRIWRGRFDVIVCNHSPWIVSNLAVAMYSKLAGIPLVGWGGTMPMAFSGSVGRILKPIWKNVKRLFYQQFSACIAYSSAGAAHFREMGVPADRIFIAYNSLDTDIWQKLSEQVLANEDPRESIRTQLGISMQAPVVICVGALIPEKRIDLLIEACNEARLRGYNNLALIIVGEGPLRPVLEQKSREQGRITWIYFTGRVSDIELSRLLHAADIFVLPGYGGLALQQAMIFGKPVISAPADGTEKDLVEHGINGFLLSRGDRRELAEYLCTLLEGGPALWHLMGAESMRIIRERVNIHTMLNGFRAALLYAAGLS